jgi:glycosyltransferase involved in cell wall biosynthesis
MEEVITQPGKATGWTAVSVNKDMGGKHIGKLSIIIPAYNEAISVTLVLDRIYGVDLVKGIAKEIIVVDDCSTDGTEQVLNLYMAANPSRKIVYLRHEKNMGKGAAIHTGIAAVTGDYIVIQDADLEYDPQDYNLLLHPVLKGGADVVYGSRFLGGHPHRILFFWHTIGNRFLTMASNIFTNLNLTDMETGYKLFRTEVLRYITLREKRFGFEPEVTARIGRIRGIRIYEVGISYYGRTYREGKKIKWKDGWRTLYCILKYAVVAKKQALVTTQALIH